MQNDPLQMWQDIYTKGEQLNRAPFDEVVSFVFRHKPDRAAHETKILEVGCGTGNNLKFLSQHGFHCSGIDGSAEGVRQANIGMSLREKYNVRQGDFRSLPYEEDSFDLVIDRAALWYVDRQDVRKAIYEVNRVLSTGGKFLFTPCRENTDDRTGEIRFDTVKQIMALLPEEHWKIIEFNRVDVWDIRGGYKVTSSHFRIVAEKVA